MYIVVVIALLILILVLYKGRNRASECKPCKKAAQAFPRLAEVTGERSLVELEADCRGTIERSNFPDLIRTMWMAERSAPELDGKGLYSFPWNEDTGKHIWNRHPIEYFGGMKGLVKATFPTKDVEFS